MSTVVVVPLPAWCRKVPARLWPGHPPIFSDGEPSEEDRLLARELIAALDAESQRWYERRGNPAL
jgi:hypothetical protein